MQSFYLLLSFKFSGMFLLPHLNPLHEDSQQKGVLAVLMAQVDSWLGVPSTQVVQAQHLDLLKFAVLTAFVRGFITLHNLSAVCSVPHLTLMISDESLAVCGTLTGSEVFL